MSGIETAKIKIELAGLSDANLIHVLGAVTFYEAYCAQDEPPDLANYIVAAFNPQQIENELADADSTFFIVYLDGKAVGYAKLRDNNKVDCVKTRNTIELQRIYVLQQVYGRGVGETLLARCLDEAVNRNRETLWLSVWEENLRAQKFYAKHNFEFVGKISFPYGSQVGTNLVLEKRLSHIA